MFAVRAGFCFDAKMSDLTSLGRFSPRFFGRPAPTRSQHRQVLTRAEKAGFYHLSKIKAGFEKVDLGSCYDNQASSIAPTSMLNYM